MKINELTVGQPVALKWFKDNGYPGVVASTGYRYDPYEPYARPTPPQEYTGKGWEKRGVLVLTAGAGERDAASMEQAVAQAAIGVDLKNPPKGWRYEVVLPQKILMPWADYLTEKAAEAVIEAQIKADKIERAKSESRKRALAVNAFAKLGILVNDIYPKSDGYHVVLDQQQYAALIGE